MSIADVWSEVDDDGPTQILFNASPRSMAALDAIQEASGDTKTQAINKAIQAYALLKTAQDNGGEVTLRETAKAKTTSVRFY